MFFKRLFSWFQCICHSCRVSKCYDDSSTEHFRDLTPSLLNPCIWTQSKSRHTPTAEIMKRNQQRWTTVSGSHPEGKHNHYIHSAHLPKKWFVGVGTPMSIVCLNYLLPFSNFQPARLWVRKLVVNSLDPSSGWTFQMLSTTKQNNTNQKLEFDELDKWHSEKLLKFSCSLKKV